MQVDSGTGSARKGGPIKPSAEVWIRRDGALVDGLTDGVRWTLATSPDEFAGSKELVPFFSRP